MAVAAGAQWRRLSSTTTVDALSIAGAYRLANNQPFSGRYTIREEFAEARIPLVKDFPLARKVTARVAARHTN